MNNEPDLSKTNTTVETISLKLSRLSPKCSGLRVVQISDIHIGGWMDLERLREVADLVIAEKPDALFSMGDFLKDRSFTKVAKQGIN